MTQPDLFTRLPLSDGPGLDPADHQRLAKHLEKVRELMSDRNWRTIHEIAERIGCSEAGASARLRDLRKQKHGGHTVKRSRIPGAAYFTRIKWRDDK